jgi:PST family polysaccharide transporter
LRPGTARNPAAEVRQPGGPTGDAEATLTERTLQAGHWRSATLLAQLGLQFSVAVVLARLLPPADFGLAGLALVVVGFVAVLADAGLTSALVYRRPLTTRHVRLAFTLSMTAALALSLALLVLAPYAAAPFRHGGLEDVLRAESPLFILTAAGSTARALLRRRLDFRRLFMIEVGSYLGGYALVAVALAGLGFGVWSLVLGALAQACVGSTLALALAPHPVRPLLILGESRQFLGYGSADTLNSLVGYVGRSADSLVIGRWLGTAELGLYTRAFSLFGVPLSYLGTAMTSVLFPAMSEIRGDARRSRSGYLLGVQLMTMIAAPLCAGVVVAAPHLVVGLYGERWRGAVLPLQILASGGTLRAVYHLGAAVTYSSGNVMAEVRRQAVLAVLLFAGAVIGTRWGIPGVATGVVAGMLFMYVAMAHLSLRIVHGTWREFFAAHLAGLTLGLQVGSVALVVRWISEGAGAGSLPTLMAITAACAATLPIGVYSLPRRLRPSDLFSRFGGSISSLPVAVRRPVMWVLRLET